MRSPVLISQLGAKSYKDAPPRVSVSRKKLRDSLELGEEQTGLPLRKVHSRLQAAAYTLAGQDWQLLFDRLDRDCSGALTADELLMAVAITI